MIFVLTYTSNVSQVLGWIICSLVGILEQFSGSAFCFLDLLLSGEVAFLSNVRASHYLDLVIVKVVFSFSLLPRISKECGSHPCSLDFGLAKLLQPLCREKYIIVFDLPSVSGSMQDRECRVTALDKITGRVLLMVRHKVYLQPALGPSGHGSCYAAVCAGAVGCTEQR